MAAIDQVQASAEGRFKAEAAAKASGQMLAKAQEKLDGARQQAMAKARDQVKREITELREKQEGAGGSQQATLLTSPNVSIESHTAKNVTDLLASMNGSIIIGEGMQGEARIGAGYAEENAGQVSESKNKATTSRIFTPVEYRGTVKVNGEARDVSRRVYRRNDIDINYFDEATGLTNLERMQAGKPPIGSDGSPIELHHILQQEVGPMAELREITHQTYFSQLHGLVGNGASFRNNPLLNKQYNNFRYYYWKWRASLITGGK